MPVTNAFMCWNADKQVVCSSADLYCLFLLILASIGEEILFRVLLQKNLINRFKLEPIVAIVTTNTLFGVVHLSNINTYASINYAIVQIMCAFSIGIVLSIIYYKYNSIVLCSFIHVMVNCTSCDWNYKGTNDFLGLSSNEICVYLVVSVFYLYFGYKIYGLGDGKN